jgi:hypothetical protein
MDTIRFEERQHFHWFAYATVILVLIGALVAAAVAFMQPGETQKLADAWWIPLLIVLGIAPALNVFQMRTTITDTQLVVQFGYLFPMYRKRIELDAINSSRMVEYRPIRDAGGWGIRFGRFEKQSCRFLNSRGNRGVLVETDDRRYIIGSQHPERLQRAIEAAANPAHVS